MQCHYLLQDDINPTTLGFCHLLHWYRYSEFPVHLLTRISIKVKTSGHLNSAPAPSSMKYRIHVLGAAWILAKQEHIFVEYKFRHKVVSYDIQEEIKSRLISGLLKINSEYMCTFMLS
jgi:hypothetical protein